MKRSTLVIIGLFVCLYIVPLGVRPMVIPDETRYAEIPREMLATGSWVVPHFDGLRYFEKPALGYWLVAASMAIFGENAFAARFPSTMATGLSALLLFLLARRYGGGYSAGILAVVHFLTSLMVLAVGTFNVLDSMLSFFLTAGLSTFFLAHMETRDNKRRGLLAIFGVFCGLAFLTKGFLALAVPLITIVPFLIWEKRMHDTLKVSWIPLLAALLTALPWAIMIHHREPDFWSFFFWNEHIRRFLSSNPQHPRAFWFFGPVLIGGSLPWSALLPAAIIGLRQRGLQSPLLRFAVCWFVLPFLFFSASRGKLPTYILPCFAPLALLAGSGLARYLEGGRRRAFFVGARLLAVVLGLTAMALVLNQIAGPPVYRAFGREETWKWMWAAAGLLSWAGLIILSARSKNPRKALFLFAGAPLLFFLSANFIMPERIVQNKAPGAFLRRHLPRIQADTVVVSDRALVSAVGWFYKRSDVYLLEQGGELGYGLRYPDSRSRLLTLDRFNQLAREKRGTNRIVLITKAKYYNEYRHAILQPTVEERYGEFVFAVF